MDVLGTVRSRLLGYGALVVAVACAGLGLSCEREAAPLEQSRVDPTEQQVGPIAIIGAPDAPDPARVALGDELFHDARLSLNGKFACATCHDLAHGGVDGMPHSLGVTGSSLPINTPTVFNSALNFRQFWDGRALSLEDQVEGPLLNPLEMGGSWEKTLSLLRADDAFATRFSKSYQEGLTRANVKDALATFERSLSTPDAPFDRYLAGNAQAISAAARRGYELFTGYGCSACHQGRGVGGNMFQKLGVMADYFADRGNETQVDLGRFNVTHDEADRHVFKVPSLRNVARTGPYLHDGSIPTLDQAVRVMARYQLGRDLDDADVTALVAFLESLTGVYRGRSL